MNLKQIIAETIEAFDKQFAVAHWDKDATFIPDYRDYAEITKFIKKKLRLVAKITADELRVEKETIRINGSDYLSKVKSGNYDDMFDYGFALAIQAQEEKFKLFME